MSPEDATAARDQLAVLLRAIDAGEVTAEPGERAHLAGALDALDRLTDPRQ